ncbi:MAG: nucleotidyltransferase domain-containing protein [Nitrospirae bacterium]|nr:nucleotidyltransferase domain-containing protein [Nitrospirota bacterium]
MKTYTEYIKAWKQREAIEEEELKAERKRALSKAKRAAIFLAEKYGVEKVILFGSLPKGRYHISSDIDLAISGLSPRIFFKAWTEVENLIDTKVDIKLIEECRGLIRDSIKKGIVLYEKKP